MAVTMIISIEFTSAKAVFAILNINAEDGEESADESNEAFDERIIN